MASVYITALFDGDTAANAARDALAKIDGVSLERVFVVHRDEQGFHVDGRYAGEPPHTWFALLGAALARILRGTSREEDSVAVSDAEQQLGVGQAALVALIHEHTPNAADAAIHACGGVVIRAAPRTLDAEDTERFLSASGMPGFVPKTRL
jgi:hypothetical protein